MTHLPSYRRGFLVGFCVCVVVSFVGWAILAGLEERDRQCSNREFGWSAVTFRCPR